MDLGDNAAFDAAVQTAISESEPRTAEPETQVEEPEEVGEDEEDDSPDFDEEPEEDDSEVEDEEPDEDDSESTFGTQEDPYTVDSFKDDEYIKVTIDGEEQVIKVKDAVQNGIRQATFQKRTKEAETLLEEGKKIVQQRAKEAQQQTQKAQKTLQGVHNLFADHQQARQYMIKHYPDTWIEMVVDGHDTLRSMIDEGHSLESLRYNAKLKRQETETLAARKKLQERDELDRKRQQTARQRKAQQKLFSQAQPALDSAALKAGIAVAEIPNDVRKEIGSWWDNAKAKGQLDKETMETIALRVLKVHVAENKGKKTKKKGPKTRHRNSRPKATVGKSQRRQSAPSGERDAYDLPSTDDILKAARMR